MTTKMKAIFMATGILLTFSSLFSQDKDKKIDSLMNVFYASNKFTGSVLVADKGNILYKRGFGQADVANSLPNQSGTVFYIASLTKPFTALLIMQMVEAGKIQTDNTLNDYFAGLKNESLGKVTIHQLLSHTSGIPDFVDASAVSEKELTNEWFTGQLNKLNTETPPGTAFKYANSTYVLLAHIIEKVSGRSYAENLKTNILDKCGMKASGSLVIPTKPKGIAKGYVNNGNIPTEVVYTNPAVFKGAGSMYSTVEDLFKFDQSLYTDALISGKYREMLFNSSGVYGYGWFIRQFPGIGKVVYHEGGIPGYTNMLFRPVEKKYFIVLLSNNQSNDTYKKDIVRGIIAILEGQ